MKAGMLLASLGLIAGGAFYFYDHRNGRKRRALLEKRISMVKKGAGKKFAEYSSAVQRNVQTLSKEWSHALRPNGRIDPTSSSKFLGTIGTGLTFLGSGKKGIVGTILRTLGLGLLVRALIAPR
jgi:hypothetical protein